MPWTIACPHCSRPLSVPDELAGAELGCPFCGGRVAVPVPMAEPVERPPDPPAGAFDFDPSEPRKPASAPDAAELAEWAARLAPAWRQVRRGLLLVRLSAWLLILVYAAVVVIVAAGTGDDPPADDSFAVLRQVFLGVQIALFLLHTVGQYLCTAVPEGEDRRAAVRSAGLGVVVLVTTAAGAFAPIPVKFYAAFASALLLPVAAYQWQVFLRALAGRLRDRGLARKVEAFTWWVWIGFGCLVLLTMLPRNDGGCLAPLATGLVVIALAVYGRLVSAALTAVAARAPTVEPGP